MQAIPSIAHSAARSPLFYGWRVVAGAFVLAVFGWGFGFYGPPVFLHAIRETRGWPLSVVSSAITVHFLVGAGVVANLPGLYSRFGVPAVTKAGAVALALGVVGWAVAAAPWQLFAATILSGAGWVALGAAAVNAIVSPWFARSRPAALSMAYNGASIGGVVFSPLWVAAIGWLGFPLASAALGAAMVLAMWLLSDLLFAQTPGQKGLLPDGDALGLAAPPVARPALRRLSGAALWRDIGFLSLVAGTALGLFAQVGLIEHLFSLLAPALGDPLAGVAMAGATAAAIAGRSLVGWLIPPDRDRRLVASLNYAVQIGGSVAFMLGAGANIPLLLVGSSCSASALAIRPHCRR
jgi:MFS family permease